jgi:signal transduction histidine kinase
MDPSVPLSVLPLLAALGLVTMAAALVDYVLNPRLAAWVPLAEGTFAAIVLLQSSGDTALLVYLAVPPTIAGLRGGVVPAVSAASAIIATLGATLAASSSTLEPGRLRESISWVVLGLGVGVLASWQSRATRDLVARQAPYAAAHQLMARLHQLASSGSLGLDSGTLAFHLEEAMKRATGAARAAVFVLEPDGQLRTLSAAMDTDDLAREATRPEEERTPGAAVVPLRGAHQVLGYCVLAGFPRWNPEISSEAHVLADDFAVRLDTAVLFDEIRLIAADEERNRIARDMHDGVAQEIVALGYVVDEIESVSSEPETLQLAANLRNEITRVVTELRYSIFDLRQDLAERDLTTALTDYVQELSRETDLRVHLVLDNKVARLPARAQSELMRIAQEAIGNVRRHARATHLWVSLLADDGDVRLEVADDGIGNATPRDRHWGLTTMQERARGIGAELCIEPRPGGGTIVRLVTPRPLSTLRESVS